METSIDENLVFVGGCSQFDQTKGLAKPFALTFDENLEYVSDLILPKNIIHTMGVSDLQKKKGTDVLFVGTNVSLFIVEWTGSHFAILNQIEQIHTCKRDY